MNAQEIRKRLRELRAEMRQLGIKKTSCFNGGMDRESYRLNARRFQLETELDLAVKREAQLGPISSD